VNTVNAVSYISIDYHLEATNLLPGLNPSNNGGNGGLLDGILGKNGILEGMGVGNVQGKTRMGRCNRSNVWKTSHGRSEIEIIPIWHSDTKINNYLTPTQSIIVGKVYEHTRISRYTKQHNLGRTLKGRRCCKSGCIISFPLGAWLA
jgi:hypothetical protein